MPKLDRSALPSTAFGGVLTVLAALFLMGGSSRADAQSLAILNPAMVICSGAALTTIRRAHWRDRKALAITIAVVFLLTALYFVPLPAQLETYSQGIATVTAIRGATDVSGAPTILAMAPYAAAQSISFLFAPLGIILFAVQLDRNDRRLILPLLIFIGTLSGTLGVLQLVGSADGQLYFYQITNNGSAVGLFANRNHAAVFLACLFPMLAIFAASPRAPHRSGRNTQQLVAVAIAIILVPLILVTGSRSGMIAAIMGLFGGLLLYISTATFYPTLKNGKSIALIIASAVLICLVFITVYFSRAEAIERFFVESHTVIDRRNFWASGLKLFWQFFPVGFGSGSFVPAFQIDEPLELLNNLYLNSLHNDWLETGLTFGVPGIILLFSVSAYYIWRTIHLWFRSDGAINSVAMGRMASVMIAILAIASLSDYPLRTPSMMGLAALAFFWLNDAKRDLQGKG